MRGIASRSCSTALLLLLCITASTCQQSTTTTSSSTTTSSTTSTTTTTEANTTDTTEAANTTTTSSETTTETTTLGSTGESTTSSPSETTSSETTTSGTTTLLNAGLTISPSNKVVVELYYTAYCRRSAYFIETQLDPAFKRLQNHMDVRLVPYGLANETQLGNGTWSFMCCPRSPINCFPDMLETCAINLQNDTAVSLSYVSCLSRVPPWRNGGPMCANRQGVNYTELQQCTTNQQGNQWFHEMGVLTAQLEPPLTRTPRIVVNGMYNSTIERKAFLDLTRLICELLQEPKPRQCSIYIEIIPDISRVAIPLPFQKR